MLESTGQMPNNGSNGTPFDCLVQFIPPFVVFIIPSTPQAHPVLQGGVIPSGIVLFHFL